MRQKDSVTRRDLIGRAAMSSVAFPMIVPATVSAHKTRHSPATHYRRLHRLRDTGERLSPSHLARLS